MSKTDLDVELAALQVAVRAGDREAIAVRLQTIERHLEAMNPLLRGMTYAHVQAVLGRPAQAAAVLEDLLELMPEAGTVHYQLGCYHRDAGEAIKAREAFVRATELDPTLVDAWIAAGILLDAEGEPGRAVDAYRHAILRDPTEIDAWRNLGNALAALDHLDQAVEAYRTATRLRPDDETLHFLVASAYKAKGELARANAVLPATLRESLGDAREARRPHGDTVLVCRFHAVEADAARAEQVAAQRLHDVAHRLTGEPSFPVALEAAFVVQRESELVLCDPDAIRPSRPHRFLDATRQVSGH